VGKNWETNIKIYLIIRFTYLSFSRNYIRTIIYIQMRYLELRNILIQMCEWEPSLLKS